MMIDMPLDSYQVYSVVSQIWTVEYKSGKVLLNLLNNEFKPFHFICSQNPYQSISAST